MQYAWDLIFAGELGLGFLEMLRKSVEEEKPVDWAKLQRDIHLMQELISRSTHSVFHFINNPLFLL